MSNRIILLCAAVGALGGCAAKDKAPAAAFRPAQLTTGDRAPVRVVQIAVPLPLPGQLLALPGKKKKAREAQSPAARIAAANRDALREPASGGYVNAVQVYPWSEGALYRLYTAPEQVSDIALEPGENLVAVAAGDTVRWIIGDTVSGSGAKRRSHVLVKPAATGLRTNLIITTDRRTYHLQLESTPATAMAAISWTYPQDQLLALQRDGWDPRQLVADPPTQPLRFRYSISGDRPPWRPLRAYDDGRQVFIEFPATLAQGEAPPLFVIGAGRGAELVNYRISGNLYIVDQLFSQAELRLGRTPQQIVRIRRTDGVPSSGRARRKP